jgi:hypothetical protein
VVIDVGYTGFCFTAGANWLIALAACYAVICGPDSARLAIEFSS